MLEPAHPSFSSAVKTNNNCRGNSRTSFFPDLFEQRVHA
jgi:hypothetical protein